ncbi:MAG: hypothetical protein KDD73_13880, partial [Anaerolineales bacterium]|nr:hypothetical protein [Anaerolineales bacterium]
MKYPRLLLGLLVAVLLIGAFAISRADDQSPELVQLDSRSASNPVTSDDNSTFTQGETWVSDPVQPVVVGKVTDATPWDGEFGIDREINPRMTLGSAIVPPPIKEGIDPLLEIQAASSAFRQPDGFETPIINQNGGGFSGVNPPDPVGDVGPDHYVQMINGSQGTIVNIYNKSDGTQAVAPFILDSLAPSGSCTNGFGDPILFFDTIEQRWLLSEFSGSGNFICTYLSDGANPVTATWTFYGFQYPTFPDYFKIGAWDGSLFISANTGLGPMLSAVNWDAMLAGSPSQLVTTTVPGLSAFSFETLTAADRDGFLDVPAGAPGIFMRHNDDEAHQPGSADPNQDWLEVWEYDVDWNNPGAATATQVADIGIAEISSELCGFTAFACVPQPNSSTTLDPLREPVMWRLQYRNFGGYETLVSNLVTDVNGNDLHGIRWFELRRSATEGGTWSLYQEGTISPDSTHRWMGAASMDGAGNIALIYNVSASSGVFPGVRYIGRLASDPLGTMPQGEYVLVNGSSPNASNRYGDYSTLTVDPVDDCTFWGTAEYNPASQWSTRIGAFRFDACGTADFTLSLNPTEVSACAPSTETVTVNVGQVSGFTDPVTLSATGVPANVTTSFAPNPVTPPGSSTLTLNISGS